ASAFGYLAAGTGAMSFQARGKSAISVCLLVDSTVDADASGSASDSPLSEPAANCTGLSVPAQSVGSSVRARCRSSYQPLIDLPKSFARRVEEIAGLVRSLWSSRERAMGSLLNDDSKSEAITSRPGPAS